MMVTPRRFLHCMLIFAIAALTAQVGPRAHAQNMRAKQSPEQQAQQMEKKKKAKEADDAYRASLRVIPDKMPAKSDPWSGMR